MRLLRATFLALLFAISALFVIAGAGLAMDAAGTKTPPVGLNLMHTLAPQIDALRLASGASSARQIVFLGDSISISTTGEARPVPMLLARELELSSKEPVELHSLAALGTGPFDYYFLAKEIADAGADDVVIALSLNAFGDTFRKMNRSENSGWVGASRLVEAGSMPIQWIGLTYDELLMNGLIVGLGGFDAWYGLAGEQARLGTARDDLARWLGARVGRRGPQTFQLARFSRDRERTRLPGRDRYTAASEMRHYGPVLRLLEPDHPVLETLAGAVAHFTRRGVGVLVYVNPINVEHLASVGVAPSPALAKSLRAIEAAVERAGGEFIDLHALLPDSAFRDAAGHYGGAMNGPAEIAPAIAAHLLDRRGS